MTKGVIGLSTRVMPGTKLKLYNDQTQAWEVYQLTDESRAAQTGEDFFEYNVLLEPAPQPSVSASDFDVIAPVSELDEPRVRMPDGKILSLLDATEYVKQLSTKLQNYQRQKP